MKKTDFELLKKRFYTYKEAFREKDSTNWKQVNLEFMINTLKEIKSKFSKIESFNADIKKMEDIINELKI